jgi:DNA-binding transcriptional LysR family regulator
MFSMALPRIDSDQLVAFQRVVREGSFSRAAVAIGVGQPAISARIQALEAAVGGALFSRGRRIALTPLGDSFLDYASRALDVLAAGVDDALRIRGGERGRVSLGVLNSLADGLAGPAIAELLAAHPALAVSVRSGAHEQIATLLWDGVVELGLVLWPSHEATAANLVPLVRLVEPVVLAVSPRDPLARQSQVRSADLIRTATPLLRLRWWRTHHPALIRIAEEAGTTVEVPLEVALHLVAQCRAIGFFPHALIAGALAAGTLRRLDVTDLPPLSRGLAVVRRDRRAPLTPATAHLVAALTRRAAALGLVAGATRRRAAGRPRTARRG